MRIAAYRAMRRADLDILPDRGASRARHGRRRPARGGALDARPAGRRGADRSWSTSRAASTERTAATWKRSERARPARSRRSTIGCAASSGRRTIRSRWSATFARIAWRLHVPAAVPDLTRARAVVEAVARRPPLRRWTRSRSSRTPRRRRPCSTSRSRTARCASRRRCGCSIACRTTGPTTGCGRRSRPPAFTIPNRSRCAKWSCRRHRRICRSFRSTRSPRLTGNAARGKTTSARCLMCHTIGGIGAELGPALDGWGRGKSAAVIATAIVRPSAEIALGYDGVGAPDQGRADDPGRADQGGRSADDAEHGRRHADHPGRPGRRAAAA